MDQISYLQLKMLLLSWGAAATAAVVGMMSFAFKPPVCHMGYP
ncbi:MAG: hypothetical protein WB443_01440 [Nitrososphaeraceae archaeon]